MPKNRLAKLARKHRQQETARAAQPQVGVLAQALESALSTTFPTLQQANPTSPKPKGPSPAGNGAPAQANPWQGPFWSCKQCGADKCWGTRLTCFRCGAQKPRVSNVVVKPAVPSKRTRRTANKEKSGEVAESPPSPVAEPDPKVAELKKAQATLATLRDLPDGTPHIAEAIADQELAVRRLQDSLKEARPWNARVQSAVDRVQGRTKDAEAAAAKVKKLSEELEAARVAATDADAKLAEAQSDLEKVRAEGSAQAAPEESTTPPTTWDQWKQKHGDALQHLAAGLQGVPPEMLEFLRVLVTAVPPTPQAPEAVPKAGEEADAAKSASTTQLDSTSNSQTQEVPSPMETEESVKRARQAKEDEEAKRARLAKT